jgi:DNA-binding transcriptional LysR family regulator
VERPQRTRSAVTHTIKKLEELPDFRVFDLRGRKAALTPAGQALYRREKAVVDEATRLDRVARELARGWEPEIRPAADIVLPASSLLECCAEFGREHPDTRIEITESVPGGTEEALVEGRVDFVVGGVVPGGFLSTH